MREVYDFFSSSLKSRWGCVHYEADKDSVYVCVACYIQLNLTYLNLRVAMNLLKLI